MRFRERLARFFYGRYFAYGFDLLSRLLIILCLVLSIFNLFFRSIVIDIIETAVFFYCFWRLFSRNISARQKENQWLLNLKNRAASGYKLKKQKFKERKTHVYKTCPSCRVTIRLPRRKGRHGVRCPKCKTNFEVTVR